MPRLCSSEFGSWIPGDVAKSVVRRCRKGWNQPFERPENRAPGWLGYIGDEILSSYIGIII